MSFLERIDECNTHDLAAFRPFEVEGVRYGWVRHDLAERLAGFGEVFAVSANAVVLSPALRDFAARSEAVERAVRVLESEGRIVGRRDEFYPVTQAFAAVPVLQIERAAVPHFGVLAFGVHMNAFVRTRNGLQMWVARRAADKPTFPGMLDNAVAGGQPIGIGLRENLLKECHEEAGIPPEIAQRATSVGALSYCKETRNGLKPDVLYCFDLELPADFVPSNTDGEVEEFLLWPITRVAETVRDSQAFKPNCNLVIIDFLVRHGVIPPEHRDYLPICLGLRR